LGKFDLLLKKELRNSSESGKLYHHEKTKQTRESETRSSRRTLDSKEGRDTESLPNETVVDGKDRGVFQRIANDDKRSDSTIGNSVARTGESGLGEREICEREASATLSSFDNEGQMQEVRNDGELRNSPQERRSLRQQAGKFGGSLQFVPHEHNKKEVVGCKEGRQEATEIKRASRMETLLLTDPPWGVSNNNANQKRKRGYSAYDPNQPSKDWLPCFGDDTPFDPAILLQFKNAVIWGANHFADKLPASSFWFCWDRKCERAADSDATDCELAWVNGKKYRTTRIFRHMWSGFQRDSQVGQRHMHPMEKPVALMRWCLKWFPDCSLVVDPYMGCGPVLVAAKREGRKAVGIELEERYCESAVKRLQQSVFEFEDAT
jgi:hypothetical protein